MNWGRTITIGRRLGAAALGTALVFGVACSSDDDGIDEQPAGESVATAVATSAATERNVTVTGVDYGFQDLPATLAAGSRLSFKNASDKELHEMVAIRLPDSETRPVSELITLPEEELGEINETEPAFVFVAMPNEDGEAVVGDGELTEPGRYAILCFIPVGANPDVLMEAMRSQNEGPPPEALQGEPHAARGMVGEIRVR